jgi:hypothetical protein
VGRSARGNATLGCGRHGPGPGRLRIATDPPVRDRTECEEILVKVISALHARVVENSA